ncbi:hypothetical protein SSX86_027754 [Deinandra increscens subsp. villosa]|uniref:Uncharacterized protein n=1 Tax=Deinandra increscens subsp. villosa TaxID=3103831 RepID=A0AAP0CCY3_9ASTR
MAYVFPSGNNKTKLVSSTNEPNQENLESNHAGDEPLFGQFPSPFYDDIPHNHHHQHTTNSTPNEPPPSPSKTKRVRKKRSAGKNDRHSKIHTAQGLRDRRMRLSLQIAHKFFGLQDMLGFDKASKTIEWLFCKSKKAIDEVTDSIKSKHTTQSPCRENIESCESPVSDCEADSGIEYFDATTSNKGKQLMKDSENTKKPTESELLARELRDKARARARERTRERMRINNNNPDKSKQVVVGTNPSDDFDHLQLGFSANPNDHYIGDSSSSLLEYPGTHQFYDHTHLNTNAAQKTEDYLGNAAAASSSTYFSGYGYNKSFANPPAGWLDSSNTLLGLVGGWDSENFAENYGLLSNLAPSTGDIHGQSFSSVLNIPPSNHVHYETQNQRD